MIAEQDRNCRSMIAEMLRDEGYSVTVTDSAADALSRTCHSISTE